MTAIASSNTKFSEKLLQFSTKPDSILRLFKKLISSVLYQIWNDMILTQILQPDCIKVPVENTGKEAVITELVDLLDANGLLLDRDTALEAVITRERIQSTGTGAGIAIPHGKCNAVKELVMAIGIAHEPIDFNSIDGKPVTILILLVSPADQTGPHIQALATISRLMLNDQFRQQLEKVTCSDEVYELLNNQQNQ